MIPTHSMWNPVYVSTPFTAVCIDIAIHVTCLYRETFVYSLVYRLFARADAKVDIFWICFVSSAQFVENIDLFIGDFLSPYLSVKG